MSARSEHRVLLFRVEADTTPDVTDEEIADVVAFHLDLNDMSTSDAPIDRVKFTLAVDVTPPRGID